MSKLWHVVIEFIPEKLTFYETGQEDSWLYLAEVKGFSFISWCRHQ